MAQKDVSFATEDDLILSGTLYLPDNQKPQTLVVLFAGSGPTDRHGNQGGGPLSKVNLYKDIAENLMKKGAAVMIYDKRACPVYKTQWEKALQENYKGTSLSEDQKLADLFAFSRTCDDAKRAVMAAQKAIPKSRFGRHIPLTLLGHSEGGLIALNISNEMAADKLVLLATAGRTLRDVLETQIYENIYQTFHDEDIAQEFLENAKSAMDQIENGSFKSSVLLLPSLHQIFNASAVKHLKETLQMDPLALARQVKAQSILIQGIEDVQINPRDDTSPLFKALQDSGAPTHKVFIKDASHCFKAVKKPSLAYDPYEAFTGETVQALYDALDQIFVDFRQNHTPQKPKSPKT